MFVKVFHRQAQAAERPLQSFEQSLRPEIEGGCMAFGVLCIAPETNLGVEPVVHGRVALAETSFWHAEFHTHRKGAIINLLLRRGASRHSDRTSSEHSCVARKILRFSLR